uniref:TIR domain-containing protein n=1 Tax=Steinernema glaseri TaxID=37863 RepID=A0A1I8AIC0_9BILA
MANREARKPPVVAGEILCVPNSCYVQYFTYAFTEGKRDFVHGERWSGQYKNERCWVWGEAVKDGVACGLYGVLLDGGDKRDGLLRAPKVPHQALLRQACLSTVYSFAEPWTRLISAFCALITHFIFTLLILAPLQPLQSLSIHVQRQSLVMNQVPRAFCEHVCDLLYINGIRGAKELSGYYGRIARTRFCHDCDYEVDVEDGSSPEGYFYADYSADVVHECEGIEAVPKKHVRSVVISMFDAKDKSVAESMKIVRRFPYSSYCFVVHCSSINKAWVDHMRSLKRLNHVEITEKLNDDALLLLGTLVTCRKLSRLIMFAEACEGGSMEIMKSLLCQDQFTELRIWNNFEDLWKDWDGAAVRKLLRFWSKNSEKLRGKNLILEMNCKGGAEQLEKFVRRRTSSSKKALQHPLKVCSKEECDLINKEYHHNHITFLKPSCVYKFEDTRKRGAQRRFYVSFECANEKELETLRQQYHVAGHGGHNDLSLMRKTDFLRIFFA